MRSFTAFRMTFVSRLCIFLQQISWFFHVVKATNEHYLSSWTPWRISCGKTNFLPYKISFFVIESRKMSVHRSHPERSRGIYVRYLMNTYQILYAQNLFIDPPVSLGMTGGGRAHIILRLIKLQTIICLRKVTNSLWDPSLRSGWQ